MNVLIMQKTIIASFCFGLCLIFSFSASTQEKNHQNHNRVGSHGMALFTVNNDLYASHLPLYRSPHDFQIIYKVNSQHSAEIINLLALQKITALPANFDLNDLVEGQRFSIPTKIYSGHFERGGKLQFEDLQFEFQKPIFIKSISEISTTTKTREKSFFLLDTSDDKKKIGIHAIQSSPSFDMIIELRKIECDVTDSLPFPTINIKLDDNTPLIEKNILEQLRKCGEITSHYFETQDFMG